MQTNTKVDIHQVLVIFITDYTSSLIQKDKIQNPKFKVFKVESNLNTYVLPIQQYYFSTISIKALSKFMLFVTPVHQITTIPVSSKIESNNSFQKDNIVKTSNKWEGTRKQVNKEACKRMKLTNM